MAKNPAAAAVANAARAATVSVAAAPVVQAAVSASESETKGARLDNLDVGNYTRDVVQDPAPAPAAPETPDPYAYQRELERQRQNSLIAQMRDFMGRNGMGALYAAMEKYVRMGYSGDAIWVMTKNDPEYQSAYAQRFAANAERARRNLPELSPATYIEMEQGYRSAFMSRGMPEGLFDSPEDFTLLIQRDVSVKEAGQRLDKAVEYINFDGNAEVRRQLRDEYGLTDAEMAAYVMNPDKTLDYLERESNRNIRRASVGGAAVNAGLGVAKSIRDQVADLMSPNPTTAFQQATQGFAAVAVETPMYERLAKLSGTTGTDDELAVEQFGLTGAAEVTNKKKILASQERARFGGSSGLGASSLSAGRRAQ